MKRKYLTTIVLFLGSLMFLLFISYGSYASIISGEVIDENGDPVPDLIVAVRSYKGNFIPERHARGGQQPVFPPPPPSNTDATGAFKIKNIVAPSVNYLSLFPEHNSDYEIRGIEIQGIAFTLHPHQFFMFDGFPFGIEQETEKIDVKITVRQRMRIQGQVLNDDGSPLRNTRINLKTKRRYVDGGSGSGSGSTQTDNEGRFTEYVDNAAYYTITIEYQGQSAVSPELLLEEGQRLDGLTLTLKGAQQAPRKPNVFRPQAPPVPKPPPNREHRHTLMQRRKEGVWAVNPKNRHAYKVISCNSPEEAIAKAAEQKAHLLAINDKDEQQWLLAVYGKENYWIGFTSGLKQDDDKKWDNGDPVTYANWDTQKLLDAPDNPDQNEENTSQTFTVLIGVTGKWQQVRADNPLINITKKAILEKKTLSLGHQLLMKKPNSPEKRRY